MPGAVWQVVFLLPLVASGHGKPEWRKEWCREAMDPGPCKFYKTTWFFDPVDLKCRKFQYGGCLGTRNRFDSKAECKEKCHVRKQPAKSVEQETSMEVKVSSKAGVCFLPHSTGWCRDESRGEWWWYFDNKFRTCRQFWFSGCGGNGNRFYSKLDCQKACENTHTDKYDLACEQCDRSVSFCVKSSKGYVKCRCKPGFTKNSRGECIDENECVSMRAKCDLNAWCQNTVGSYRCVCYAGYKGNGKTCKYVGRTVMTWECAQCHMHALCDESGKCRCKNGFTGDGYYCSDVNECLLPQPLCSLQAKCENLLGSFRCSCKEGYAGNGFHCTPSPDVCYDAFEEGYTGQCSKGEWLPRYYYEHKTKSCRRFWYDGCKGDSRNIFSDLHTCQSLCERTNRIPTNPIIPPSACSDPFDPALKASCGRGEWKRKFYYEETSKRCRMFWYDACQGKGNNLFHDLITCQLMCEQKDFSYFAAQQETAIGKPTTTQSDTPGKVRIGAAVHFEKEEKNSFNKTEHHHKAVGGYIAARITEAQPRNEIMGFRIKATLETFYPFGDQPRPSFPTSGHCEEKLDMAYQGTCRGGQWEGRFYFDSKLGRCRMLWWDGCEGKGRNFFNNLDICRWICERSPTPPDSKSCLEKFDEKWRESCGGQGWEEKYFFDQGSGKCVLFWYNGCAAPLPPSVNFFHSHQQCHSLCATAPISVSNACSEPLDSKYLEDCGGERQARYYYDEKRRECRLVWHGNCKGSGANLFPDLSTCQWACVESVAPQPPKACIDKFDEHYRDSCGDGAWQERFYFDHRKGQCVRFWWDHCLSSSTNFFPDINTCKHLCELPSPPYRPSLIPDECLEHLDKGNCSAAYPALYYDRWEGRCKPFSYSGCGGNRNRFLSLRQCETTCMALSDTKGVESDCLLPLEVGFGRHSSDCLQRSGYHFYYNRDYEKCGRFWYFGCGGNENRFVTEVECRVKCSKKRRLVQDIRSANPGDCFLPKDNGKCEYIEEKPRGRWYYDHTSESCAPFEYNGCGGNNNRFSSEKMCQMACGGLKKPRSMICAAHPDWGPCSELRWMWFYNMTIGRCQQFLWGGCQGNLNRFDDFPTCQRTCEIPTGSKCDEELDRGNWCAKMITQYYFNKVEGRCKGFHYTGCGKSPNRFATQDDCEAECILKTVVSIGDGTGLSYQGTAPPAKAPMIRPKVIKALATKNHMKTPPVWVEPGFCIGFRYNISSNNTELETYLCEEGGTGECVEAVFGPTEGEEFCQLLRPWSRKPAMFAFYFSLVTKGEPWNQLPPAHTLATVMPLGLNPCSDPPC